MNTSSETASYKVIGLMSGTSLDGLDIAYCHFALGPAGWRFELLAADTVPYSHEWKHLLGNLENASAYQYALANVHLGEYFGQEVKKFMETHRAAPDFIASHGHTIFHQPGLGLTTQIGNGASIAAEVGRPVVCDFRTGDVALGGQGAPLVPIGDRLLFGQYECCINLGGIANFSAEQGGERIAYDICFCNMLLNHLAQALGHAYDAGGALARSAPPDEALLAALNAMPYLGKPYPKSLGKEDFVAEVLPLLQASAAPPAHQLRTATEHVAQQLARHIAGFTGSEARILLTGGGALNTFLVERLQHYGPQWHIDTHDEAVINFKEAIVFAFLGVLRWRHEANCLRSVTGAQRDNCSGAIYWA